ncbi:hypothetical protein C6382_22315 [Pseudomonas sp. BBP2017]|nr:hypothetical protein C6382_22315 [Pseudomonas sp. BBP2017]
MFSGLPAGAGARVAGLPRDSEASVPTARNFPGHERTLLMIFHQNQLMVCAVLAQRYAARA